MRKRALLSCSDKSGLKALGVCLSRHGVELVATGKTAEVLKAAGLAVTPVETLSGSPEAFQGRMKTLSFPLLSGVLFRRGDAQDEQDVKRLNVPAIDVVVVNFYPFEQDPTVEQIDVGGPTLVRAAAKNAPDVLVLVSPDQYTSVIEEWDREGTVSSATAQRCAARAWDRVLAYDQAIASRMGETGSLRYGENPHQQAAFKVEAASPIEWKALTSQDLSYNNILDVSSGYLLMHALLTWKPQARVAVVIKHGNPCGVALSERVSMLQVLESAWSGDPVSAFGGVVLVSHALDSETAAWLSDRFIEVLVAPSLSAADPHLVGLSAKRKKLKAVAVRSWSPEAWKVAGAAPLERVSVVGGVLEQTRDMGLNETLRSVTKKPFPDLKKSLAMFGIAVSRALKSNAVAIVAESAEGVLLLWGAGQGQPNRVEAIRDLCVPRALKTCEATHGILAEAVAVSDAFFPFPDSVELLRQGGIQWVVQPGGSIKDADVVAAADRLEIGMAMTGVRHFKHV